MSKKAKFGFGLVLGAVAGVVAGLLTAPKSGKETRAELKRKKDDAQDKATAKVNEVRGKANDKAEELKGRAREAANDAKDRADIFFSNATRAAESAKEAWDKEDEESKSRSKK